MKNEREMLTREFVAQKLIRDAKRSMVGSALILILGFLLFGMLRVMSSFISSSVSILAYIFEIVFAAVCVFFFVRGALKMSKARHGKFSVVEEVLSKVRDERLNIWKMIFLTGRIFSVDNYEHIFEFESGKKFIINSRENTTLDATAGFSIPKDAFFTVFYNDRPEKIVWIYSSKLYDYKPADLK